MISETDHFKLPTALGNRYLCNSGFAAAALFILLLLIYANSFKAGWQYDDYLNIVKNTNIQMENFSWQAVLKSFDGVNQDKKVFARPVAFFSFAVNYYFHQYDVTGYHIVNFAIHAVASIFLYLFIKNALRLPACGGRFDDSAETIALLALFLWATHPIQVTAVTYIVQRMTSMAGMFYIMAMYFFLRARTLSVKCWKYLFWGLFILSGGLAFGSKENAFMLPISVFLLDLMVVQFPNKRSVKMNSAIFVLLVIAFFAVSIGYVDWSKIQKSFDNRPFSLGQRLLTEPRVIGFYLSLLFYPTTSRLMLLHDIPPSTGWVTPWQTTASLLLLVVLIVGAILCRRRYPFISYCILFFFLNHLIEGSVIALELVYEHRNYLPSMLIFVPVAAAIVKILDFFAYRVALQGMVAFLAAFVLWAHAYTTYCYNSIFQDELSLWKDNVEKAPNLSITHNNFGQALRMAGKPKQAMAQFETALQLNRYNNNRQRGIVLYNMGLHEAYEEKSYHRAMQLLEEALHYLPLYPDLIQHTALVALVTGKSERAEQLLQQGLKYRPKDPGLIQATAILRLSQHQFSEALYLAARAYQIAPHQFMPLKIMAAASRRAGHNMLAVHYWEKVMGKDPTSPLGAFSLALLYHDLNKTNARDRYLGLLQYLKHNNTWQEYWNLNQKTEMNQYLIPDFQELRPLLK